jgi:hypothetical protein
MRWICGGHRTVAIGFYGRDPRGKRSCGLITCNEAMRIEGCKFLRDANFCSRGEMNMHQRQVRDKICWMNTHQRQVADTSKISWMTALNYTRPHRPCCSMVHARNGVGQVHAHARLPCIAAGSDSNTRSPTCGECYLTLPTSVSANRLA